MGQEITIEGKDGSFMGYLASPKTGGNAPGVVVIQEIFGVNTWVRGVTDMFAAEGYRALALDLFWRMKPKVQLDPTKPDELKEGFGYYQKFDKDKGLVDIQTAITHLRKMPGGNGKVGNIGFCLGGLLSYLSAANSDTDASGSYYGGGINTMLSEMAKIKKPAVLHLAGNDEYMPKPAQDEIAAAAAKTNGNVSVHVYPGAAHAFCRSNDPSHYKEDACKQAHARTLALFKTALA